MNTKNPYSAPLEDGKMLQETRELKSGPLGAIAKQTFLAWEKLRLVYIGVLAVVTIGACLIFPEALNHFEFWASAIFGAIVANVCYFLAPTIESYVKWLGFPTRTLRIALFTVGTIFASGLAVGTVIVTSGI